MNVYVTRLILLDFGIDNIICDWIYGVNMGSRLWPPHLSKHGSDICFVW